MKKKALYLRTLALYNLKSGGSVGHTSGVINAMSEVVDLDVVSNDKLTGLRVPIRVIKPILSFLPIFGEMFFNIRLVLGLKKINTYDYIYQRHAPESFAGAFLAKKYKIPLILEFNSSETWKLLHWTKKRNFPLNIIFRFYHLFLKYPIAKIVEDYNLKNADAIVVVSKVLKENLVKRGITKEKILVNPNGVDKDIYQPNVDCTDLKNELKINNKQVVGFIGTFGPWHGGLILAEAINEFYSKFPEFKDSVVFLLIGDGKQLPGVKSIILNEYQGKQVIFTGRVEQSLGPQYLSACSIFLSPHIPNPDGTEFFGSPTKLFEYMSMARPIVASKLNQIGDILENEKTALLIEPNKPVLLADSIKRLLDEPEFGKEIALNAREEVIANYSWNKHVQKILAFIDENNKN